MNLNNLFLASYEAQREAQPFEGRVVCQNTSLHCSETNPELWGNFSDCYKSFEGVRPRFFMSEADADAWFARREQENQEAEKEAQLQASIAAGTHPAFTTASAKLEFSPFANL